MRPVGVHGLREPPGTSVPEARRRSRAQPEVERLGSLVAAAARRALGRAGPGAPETSIGLERVCGPIAAQEHRTVCGVRRRWPIGARR